MQEELEPQDNKRKSSFLINLLSSIENFNLSMFKQQKQEKKEQREEVNEIDSFVTLSLIGSLISS